MKKQLNQLRRFFARTGARKLNAATAREAIPASYDDDDGSNRLSGAFIVVLLLHVIALVGVFAFSRMKDTKIVKDSGPAASPAGGAASTPKASAPAPKTEPVESAGSGAQYAAATATKTAAPSLVDNVGSASHGSNADAARTLNRSARSPHIVQAGETLSKIAVANNVRPSDIAAANNLKSDEIKIGQELIIPETKTVKTTPAAKPATAVATPEKPAATSPKAAPGTYVVKKNQTLVKIAHELGVAYDDLAKINNIKDPRKLREGQILKVPAKT
jgi:LysM repeat protein